MGTTIIAASTLLPLLGSNLIACSDGNDHRQSETPPPETPAITAQFLHGVASGDPLSDRVIIWIRVTPDSEGEVLVVWEVANQDIDAVLHLGDYLYEYGEDGYATDRAQEYGRVPQPSHEILSLEDYRTRYAQYRGDVDLQAAHAAHPFILVWDDHEVANDTWREGADNHDPETEGSFSARKAAAIQAWYEWLPVRRPASEQEIIYRKLPYGDLVDLLMLDTRVIARDEQSTYPDFATGALLMSMPRAPRSMTAIGSCWVMSN